MPSHESALVTAAKRLARCQAARRKAKRDLRIIEAEIKIARKELRALAASALDRPFEDEPELNRAPFAPYQAEADEILDQLPPRNGRQIRRRQK